MTCLSRNILALFAAILVCAGAFGTVRAADCYYPDSVGGIVCHNGQNRYTRALYGAQTAFRLETSDRPVFCAYTKALRRNISFSIYGVALDSTTNCTSTYHDGIRSYSLSDPAWGDLTATITAVVGKTRENAIFRIDVAGSPKYAILTASCRPTKKVKFSRNGDMGVDDPEGYEAATNDDMEGISVCSAKINKPYYIEYADGRISDTDQKKLEKEYDKAVADAKTLASQIKIDTPDPYLNCLGQVLSLAGDAIWDGDTYLHGAIGWRMPLAGWRGAYTGDFLGWHDRATNHFDAYAASQVRDVPPVIPHPAQDTTLHMARAEKRWGTQMYSDGYICRNPGRNDQMHHYDMDLCYLDEALWHLQWTGDTAAARRLWSVIKSALAWEKRNYDPDDDGLYDAYCCIWASDALYYNGGAATHSSALNHRANLIAAKVATLVGDDPAPYRAEAAKIRAAIDSVLFMPHPGVWAECRDLMGEQRLHTHPGLWTIYHTIDSECASPEQAYLATRWIDEQIPHIPVGEGIDMPSDLKGHCMLSTTDWQPYAWSINNVVFAENYHTALAYWQAGRPEEATRLLRAAVLDGMYLGRSPGNIGQISTLDAARGECYRDFADPVGVLSRAVVQGLFGFKPQALDRCIEIRPGFPADWDHASIQHPDFELVYKQIRGSVLPIACNPPYRADIYTLEVSAELKDVTDSIEWILPAYTDDPRIMLLDGTFLPATIVDAGTPYATVRCTTPHHLKSKKNKDLPTGIMVSWRGQIIQKADAATTEHDSDIYEKTPAGVAIPDSITRCTPVDISAYCNGDAADIFRNSYLSPRPPYTTLQIPTQGIGEWCHPLDSAEICDNALRQGPLTTPQGIIFSLAETADNAVYTTLFDNYPDCVDIPLEADGVYQGIALLMAGSTNHMQSHITNATVTVTYADGTSDCLELVPPLNWAPIEQDYYSDGYAFRLPDERPLRLALDTGEWSRNLGDDLGLGGPGERRIPGGAATVLYLPLQQKTPTSLRLKTNANDVVTMLLAASLIE